MENIVVVSQDSRVDTLLQIIAVLLGRLGGEAVINSGEYGMYEDVPVLARTLGGGYTLLRLGGKDEKSPEVPEPIIRPEPPKCPKCGEAATYQTPDGTYWDSMAHYWRVDPPLENQ